MSRAKVAHITTVDASLRYLLLDQLMDLRDRGYEVVGISSPGPDVCALEDAGIRHRAVDMTRSARSPIADLRALFSIHQILRQENCVVVHTHTPKAGVLGRVAAKLARVPVIVHTNHGFVFQEGTGLLRSLPFVALERLAATCCDSILSVNREDILTAIRLGIAGRDKISVIGEGGIGVNLGRFNPDRFSTEQRARERASLGIPSDALVVGFVGRLVREKGVLDLMDAVSSIRGSLSSVFLLFVGPTDMAKRDAIEPADALKHYKLADISVFTGNTDRPEEMMALMDLLVLPSYREGFGLVLAEAAAMALPVVATNIRGCREAVVNGKSGVLVPVGDVKALAGAIETLLSSPAKAREMGDFGRHIAEEKFDRQFVFRRVDAEYERLIRLRRSS